MTEMNVWQNVDHYFMDKLLPKNENLNAVLQANKAASIPEIDVSPTQGRLLYLLAKMKGVANILEIGTLGGYSSICLAKALPREGKLVTLEIMKSTQRLQGKISRMQAMRKKLRLLLETH